MCGRYTARVLSVYNPNPNPPNRRYEGKLVNVAKKPNLTEWKCAGAPAHAEASGQKSGCDSTPSL